MTNKQLLRPANTTLIKQQQNYIISIYAGVSHLFMQLYYATDTATLNLVTQQHYITALH